MSDHLSISQVVDTIRQGLNQPDEHQKLIHLFNTVAPHWQQLDQQGQLTDEHRSVLGLFRQRLQELIQQKQQSVEGLVAASEQLKCEAQRVGGATFGCSPGGGHGSYLQASAPAGVQGAYLQAAPESFSGAYLQTGAAVPQGAYLQSSAGAHTRAGEAVAAVQQIAQIHANVARSIHERNAIIEQAITAQHAASAEISRHILAAQVCNIHTQQIALASQARSLIAAMPSGYLQKDMATQPASPEHAKAAQQALADVSAKLQAHTQAIVDIQRALQSASEKGN